MTVEQTIVQDWCIQAGKFLDETPSWINMPKQPDTFKVSYKGKSWILKVDDLEQLAHDLGILTYMYPEEIPVIKEVQPEPRRFPYIRYSQRDKAWIIVVDTLVYIDGNTAGELLNAGIPFKP